MKFILIFLLSISFAVTIAAQKSDDVLATVGGQNFTTKDLPLPAQKIWLSLPSAIAEARSEMLSQTVTKILLENEAKAQNSTAEKLIADVKAKVPAPSEQDIKAVYDNNRDQLGSLTFEQARPQIVQFLRGEPEQKSLRTFFSGLETKYKVTYGKDVNAPDLKPSDSLANVGGKTISVQEFEENNKVRLYDVRADLFDAAKNNLENAIYLNLLTAEAAAQGIDTSDLIKKEISDKMPEYSDEKADELQKAFERRLFAKYNVKIALAEPAPIVQEISAAESPSRGSLNAPVTIVMFSDFQCSHCAKTHPILQKILAEYKDKVRFVVRDYPLTTIHENAFQAALAANAAFRQGKFFEYIDVLYANQDKLDKDSLKKYAADLGLNPAKFELDLNDEKNAAAVRKDLADGDKYGITGTPTIFINGIKVRDNSADGFRAVIEKALKK